nr:unnamed protein product [Digitaria exilis]
MSLPGKCRQKLQGTTREVPVEGAEEGEEEAGATVTGDLGAAREVPVESEEEGEKEAGEEDEKSSAPCSDPKNWGGGVKGKASDG